MAVLVADLVLLKTIWEVFKVVTDRFLLKDDLERYCGGCSKTGTSTTGSSHESIELSTLQRSAVVEVELAGAGIRRELSWPQSYAGATTDKMKSIPLAEVYERYP